MEEIKALAEKLSAKFYSYDEANVENRRIWNEIAEEFGVEFVGSGISRVVFKCGNYVIKVSQEWDYGQNIQEVKTWKYYASTAAKKFFAPIVDHAEDYSYIIQEYAGESLGGCMSVNDAIASLEDFLGVLDYYNIKWGDVHIWNVSLSKKIFDYGLFDGVSDAESY